MESATGTIADPLDSLLSLEDQYYTEGFNLGVADGSRAGRIEGRIFGLEKGFEKFAGMGRLGGRAAVWKARTEDGGDGESGVKLDTSERLTKHIHRLHTLTDVSTLSTENSEDAVSEFDDRFKDATAKARLISRIVGEDEAYHETTSASSAQLSPGKRASLRMREDETESNEPKGRGKGTGEMEDFAGLRLTTRTKKTG
ncbi:hypothetical protein LTR37_010541 [Vermiconidia calcicola]|uniref:Uncharacterized protein n=1 Tax=Vermiconidia calcicola TaxID=1690605 RepID=A0ACC3N632_9PEZI|nr:hypothetical protein LTR37_010541 [Vermiconidia calcicola]